MCCKKHLNDTTSDIGVCASCLRDKLLPILAVQSVAHPSPLIFPRSVSPPHVTKANDQKRLFHSTPQLTPLNPFQNPVKKDKARFSLFRKKVNSDTAATSSSPLPPWLSDIFSSKAKNQESRTSRGRRKGSGRARGMSPARVSDSDGEDECQRTCSHETPKREGPAARRGGGGRGFGEVAGFAFCISPLVRARPKVGSVKSMPKEVGVVVVKPQMTTAGSFCKNKSRKIADFGRHHRRY